MEECSGQREQYRLKSPLFRALCVYVCVGSGDGRWMDSKTMNFVSYLHETWPVACLLQASNRFLQLKIGADVSTNEQSIQSP